MELQQFQVKVLLNHLARFLLYNKEIFSFPTKNFFPYSRIGFAGHCKLPDRCMRSVVVDLYRNLWTDPDIFCKVCKFCPATSHLHLVAQHNLFRLQLSFFYFCFEFANFSSVCCFFRINFSDQYSYLAIYHRFCFLRGHQWLCCGGWGSPPP